MIYVALQDITMNAMLVIKRNIQITILMHLAQHVEELVQQQKHVIQIYAYMLTSLFINILVQYVRQFKEQVLIHGETEYAVNVVLLAHIHGIVQQVLVTIVEQAVHIVELHMLIMESVQHVDINMKHMDKVQP